MSLWLNPNPLILASKSLVRRAVLESAGIPVITQPADIDERAVEAASGAVRPGDVAVQLAIAKAWIISARSPGRLVLGADQTLAAENQRFSKPLSRDDARTQLRTLRGRTHQLHSGIAIVRNREMIYRHVAVANLTMRSFSDSFLDAYLTEAGSAVSQSVGGYQLERIGVHLFERVEGDHFTILGLPLLPLLDFLRREGSLT